MLFSAIFLGFIVAIALLAAYDEQRMGRELQEAVEGRPRLALPEHDIYLAKEVAYTPARETHPVEGSYCWYCKGTCSRR